MSNMLLIARREYLEQIRGRAFKLSTIGLPALFALIIGVGYVASLGLGHNKHLVITSNNPVLAQAIRIQLLSGKDGDADVKVVAPEEPETRAALIRQIQAKSIDGVLSIETPTEGTPTATYTSQSSGDFMTGDRLRSA